MELRESILEGTLKAFNQKGLKFTMDDLAGILGMSKKTIYTVFQDKNTLVSEMVDYCFDSIKESEQKVLSDTSLDTVGKIRAILGVLPEGYKDIDFRQLYLLKDKYPKMITDVHEMYETKLLLQEVLDHILFHKSYAYSYPQYALLLLLSFL